MEPNNIYILGIESSCDDTAAAVLSNDAVLSNVVANQDVHKAYGGVVPELASRAHQQNIVPVVARALSLAGIEKEQLHAIAYTKGPGLLGSLLVGSSFAKSMAMALGIPLIEVNHMQAHLLANFIKTDVPPPKYPFLGVTISGGHTQIVNVTGPFKMTVIGQTLDDAIGEVFDKSAKTLGLSYPGGPLINKYASLGNPWSFEFGKPKVEGLNFSFSGLKTSILYFVRQKTAENEHFVTERRDDLCASIQRAITDILMEKIELAAKQSGLSRIVLGGGVSANSHIRESLRMAAEKHRWEVFVPKPEYTTDNAAMIGIVGFLKYRQNDFASFSEAPQARYQLS